MRVARRRRYPFPPSALWARLDDPRDWTGLLATPGAAEPRRVKVLDGATPVPGARLQVLRADHSWTIYAIERWQPERQVRLLALQSGQGQGPGEDVPGELTERLILIPQGSDTEAEWTVDHRGALLSRLFSAPGPDAWSVVLEGRLDALQELAGPGAAPGPED